MTTVATNLVGPELAARCSTVEKELTAGAAVLQGLVQLLSAEMMSNGILLDLGIPLGREGVTMHAVEVAHFLHTADQHSIDLVHELSVLIHAHNTDEDTPRKAAEVEEQLAQARGASEEALSQALSALERLRAGGLGDPKQVREMSTQSKKVMHFCDGLDISRRMLNYVQGVASGEQLDPRAMLGRHEIVVVSSPEELMTALHASIEGMQD